MIFPKEKLGVMDKYIFLETAWGAGAGTIGILKNLISDFLVGGVVLKVFGIERYWWLLPIFGVVYIAFTLTLGLFLIKKNIVGRRGAWSNRLGNPQLMEVLEKLKHGKE